MKDITLILSQIESGEASSEDLLMVVYTQLRHMAQSKMAAERPDHTLQATVLVHDAWLRLGGNNQATWKNRRHFFAAAAEAMRRILIDHARLRNTKKRGGGATRIELENSDLQVEATPDELEAIDEALDELQREDPQAAELVKMRYFIGLTMQQAADALGIKKRAAEGLWDYSRAWLRHRIRNSS